MNFFSNLEILEYANDDYHQYTMSVRLTNKEHIVTPKLLIDWLEYYRERLCGVPKNYDDHDSLTAVLDFGGIHDPHKSKKKKN